jgi:hypothetical protein
MTFDFVISPHEYEAGTVFKDATCYGVYIEIGSDETFNWFQEQGFEGNGYTLLALVESLCKLTLKDVIDKYEMEAEVDNTWVYSREKQPIDRLIEAFREATNSEDGIKHLIDNASDELME